MEAEYNALRNEMLAWQNRRFSTLATAITVTIGLLGLDGVLKGTPNISWPLVTALLWFFLGAVSLLTWYASRANSKLAAYISVFHEEQANGWESRLNKLKNKGLDRLTLNIMILSIYLGLGIISLIIPLEVRNYESVNHYEIFILTLAGLWFVVSQVLLTVEPPREYYKTLWQINNDTQEKEDKC